MSIAVALAEKIDKLTGFWAIDEKPTGSKDPFALRRAALGVIRILVENDMRIDLLKHVQESGEGIVLDVVATKHKIEDQNEAVQEARKQLSRARSTTNHNASAISAAESALKTLHQTNDNLINEVRLVRENIATVPSDLLSFLHDRLKVYLKDQGVRHDIIDACIAMDGNDDLTLLVKRAKALSETLKTDDGENLIQGFKRANNILSQAEDADGVEYSFGADIKFAETEEERALFAALDTAEAQIKPAMEAQDFGTAMSAMAFLRGPIDAFFDAVQVNSDNATIRRNRLNLLSRIRTICSSVADLTKIDG